MSFPLTRIEEPIHREAHTVSDIVDHMALLNSRQLSDLENLVASFRMEGMEFSDAELDVLAQFTLGKLTREEAFATMDALGH